MGTNLAQAAPGYTLELKPETQGTVELKSVPFVGLEEYKTSMIMNLKQSQSRMVRIKNRIIRTSISDPSIAEPVVVSECEIVILGKASGIATLGFWDDAGNVSVIELRVRSNHDSLGSSMTAFGAALYAHMRGKAPKPIPPVKVGALTLEECQVTKVVDIEVSKSKMFETTNRIVRTSISNPAIANVVASAENGVYLQGKAPGEATVFIWDDAGRIVGIKLLVTKPHSGTDGSSLTSPSDTSEQMPVPKVELSSAAVISDRWEIERWSGSQKDIQNLPLLGGFSTAPTKSTIALNNEGVVALKNGHFQLAISKFKAALRIDPKYQLARDNIAIAYNNYGLTLATKPKEAIKQFHEALYLNRTNPITLTNVERIINYLGRDPDSFEDRCELGEYAMRNGDFVGAVIEYEAALQMHDDAELHVKLDDARKKLGDVYK